MGGERVEHEPDRQRYELSVGGERVGYTAYVDDDDRRIFYHTVIDERLSGRGLASTLVSAALTDARNAGRRVVPLCPFVDKYVKSHHDFDDILAPVTPAAMDVVLARRTPPAP